VNVNPVTRRRRAMALALGAALGTAPLLAAADPPHAFHGLASATPKRAAEFTLTAHTGQRFRLSGFRGKTVLLYFGYTSCPGICPTTLADVHQALSTLPPKRASKVQLIMVTVDPERDTPEKLAAYVTHFDPTFLGATGTPAEIAAVTRLYGIYVRRGEGTAATGYLIDHTSMVFAIDPRGYVQVLFPHGIAVADMSGDLAYLVR
jgi:protein SCO1/2